MKKLAKLLSVVFCLFMAVACTSKINTIKNAYTNEGYAWEKIELEENTEENTSKDTKKEESMIKGVYYASKGLTAHIIVIELQSTKDMEDAIQALKEDPNIDGNAILETVLNHYKSSEYTYGNCVLIASPLDNASIEIWNSITKKNESK